MTIAAPTLDLSGLSPEAVLAATVYVDYLRQSQTTPPARVSHLRDGETPEQWIKRFDAWVASHTGGNPDMDDSRDSIYD